jgi:hypothetical protein
VVGIMISAVFLVLLRKRGSSTPPIF